jgi:hypothetical protein
VKDEQGRYQLATVRPPSGSPGGAPLTATPAAPGGQPGRFPPGTVQTAGPGAGAPTGSTAPAAAPAAPTTYIDPETGLPVLSGPPNPMLPGQPGAPARPAAAVAQAPAAYATAPTKEAAVAQAKATGRPVLIDGGQGAAALPNGNMVANLPDLPATPAQAQPPAAAAPQPPPPAAAPFTAPPPVNPRSGLNAVQEAQVRAELPVAMRSLEGQAQLNAKVQQWRQQNLADQRQYETAVSGWQNQQETAQREAERLRLSQEADKRAAEEAERKAAEAKRPVQGNDIAAQHESTLLELAPKMRDGTANDQEKARYSGAYYALQQSGGQPVTMTDPSDSSRTIPAMITRRLAPELPEPPGGALPLVMMQPGAGKQDQMNDAQATSANYADRMVTANRVMGALDADATTWAQKVRERAGNFIGYNINSPEYQRLRQAQENFLIGILRKESGAAVSQAEWDRYAKFYFPMPGDDATTVKQKQETREQAMRGLQREAGPAYKVLNGPRIGSVEDGYRFKGGDPADKTNWEQVK